MTTECYSTEYEKGGEIIPSQYFDFSIIENAAKAKRKGGTRRGDKKTYKDLVCAFDIETTRIEEIDQSIMYIWQFQIDEICTVYGRTWDEYQAFIAQICEALGDDYLVVYVHNLSYEFQFLAGIYPFKTSEVFAVESRKVLKCEMYGHIEYRCSYLQTNMSLGQFTKKMGVKHQKLSGAEFDYTKLRYPWTELTDRELEYCVNDVWGLVEAIKAEMQRDNDNLYTIPMTSTGYVRRDAKKVMNARSIKAGVIDSQPDIDLYMALRDAFRGGDTHASRFYAGAIVENVESYDRSSSYPDVIVNCQYPITPFYHVGAASLDDAKYYMKKGRALLMRIAMYNVRLLDKYSPVPYIPKAKTQSCVNAEIDNGRVLSAEYLEMAVTDIDMQIILNQYDADNIVIEDMWHSRYGYLPRAYRELVKKYYVTKTGLKGVEGMEVYYEKLKNLLNALFGLMAQDPVKQTIEFIQGEFIRGAQPVGELLDSAVKKAFLCYQWGVWVTAHARRELRQAIDLCGMYFVYTDTDSVKYVKSDIDWETLNAGIRQRSIDSGAYATDPKGNAHYMGVWEHDDSYSKFKTLGAKKYAYVYKDKKCKPDKCGRAGNCTFKGGEYCKGTYCTIAGVGKRRGAEEIDKAGGLEAFDVGFIFHDAGGLESVYNDDDFGEYTIDGHDIYITRNVCLRPSTYTVSITEDYATLLDSDLVQKFMEELKMANYKRNTKKAETKSGKLAAVAPNSIITDVRVFPIEDGKGILANVSVTFGGVFVVTGLKVIDGKKGAFVSMPQYKSRDGEWKDSCFPITAEFREELSDAVLEAYEDEVE